MAILTLIGMLLLADGEVHVGPEKIKQAVLEFIRQLYSSSTEETVVEFRSLPDRTFVASNSYELRVAPEGGNLLRGTLLLPLEIVVDGRTTHRFFVSVRVRTFGDILVAKTHIPKNASFREEDIQRQHVETTLAPLDRVTSSAELVGKRATRIITPGNILCRSMLEVKPTIQRNQMIDLELKTGKVMIVAKAIAKEDGYWGKMIEVQRMNSRERLRARVVDQKTVRIEFR